MPDVDWLRDLCLSLPEARENIQWGDDLCFKVRGKIFTTVVLSDGKFPRLCFKCTPEKFHELLEMEGISIAPYVGRYNWVLLANSNVLPEQELEKLIRQSHALVIAKTPKKKARGKKASRRSARSKRGG
jgi:predicted DNA-binding protein (MmcQ/YjbR family)